MADLTSAVFKTLHGFRESQFMVLTGNPGNRDERLPMPYVQTMRLRGQVFVTEISFNTQLTVPNHLRPMQELKALELGFFMPDEDIPNFWIGSRSVANATHNTVTALRQVLRLLPHTTIVRDAGAMLDDVPEPHLQGLLDFLDGAWERHYDEHVKKSA